MSVPDDHNHMGVSPMHHAYRAWWLLDTIRQIRALPCVEPVSEEMLALARQAVAAKERRKNEDVQEWARRLAADVGHLTD